MVLEKKVLRAKRFREVFVMDASTWKGDTAVSLSKAMIMKDVLVYYRIDLLESVRDTEFCIFIYKDNLFQPALFASSQCTYIPAKYKRRII